MAWYDRPLAERRLLAAPVTDHACADCLHSHQPRLYRQRYWIRRVCNNCPCREYVKP